MHPQQALSVRSEANHSEDGCDSDAITRMMGHYAEFPAGSPCGGCDVCQDGA